MAQTFRGEFQQKLDGKGRVSVPAPFRRVIEKGDPEWMEGLRPNFAIVYGGAKRQFLECYTIQGIDEIDRRIKRMAIGSTERKRLERLYSTFSLVTNIDDDGRIVLSQKMRDKLDLDAEILFAAAGDRFEIWKPETWADQVGDDIDEWLDEMPDDFDPRSLLPELPEEA